MNKNSNQSGFTLLELSVVLIISGLMVVAAIEAYKVYDEKRKIDQINTQMADLDQYIKNFPTMIDPATVDPVTGIGTPYGRFPCPAPMDGTGAGNDFDSEDCTIAPIAGVQPNGANGGAPVLVGKIPAATLGLHSDYMRDPHGNYLVYAVTQGASNSATYGTTTGSIQVIEEGIDRNPASATRGQIVELERHNNVQYMVVSMGDTDAGAYAFNGVQAVACPANNVKEHENCDGDARFITSLLHDRNTNDFYDDKLLFAANTVVVPNNEEPAACEQIDIFSMPAETCPKGWSRNEKLEQTGAQVATSPTLTPDMMGVLGAQSSASASTSHHNFPSLHYNVDKETGEYYFTSFTTDDTVMGTEQDSGFDFGRDKNIICERNEDTPPKQKCGKKEVSYQVTHQNIGGGRWPTGPLNDNTINAYARKAKKKCPEGYKPFSIVGGRYSTSRENNNGDTNTTNFGTVTVTCTQ